MQIKFSNIFKNKYFLTIILLTFIILNILDFLNKLSYDFDILKKILSWSIIIYVFYKISFSKIFIGERFKKFDIAYIFAFSLMVIPKSVYLFLINTYTNLNSPLELNYYLEFLIFPLIKVLNNNIIFLFLLLGIIASSIISILLLLEKRPKKNSLIASFNLNKDDFFHRFFEIIILIFFSIFFGIVVFNFFMEWFALAVDAIILVMGMLYYLFKIIHDHTKTKFSYYLKEVSNTGNDFYMKLINYFADKKTIFLGVSFLLVLHLMVDIGVFFFPYLLGTENTLYFSSIETEFQTHQSLFNLLDFKKSLLYEDISKVDFDILFIFSISLIYLIYFLSFLLLMFFPFYILYKNINKEKIEFTGKFYAFIFSGFIFIFLINLGVFSIIQNPINISPITVDSNLHGVDIHTKNLLVPNLTYENYFEIPFSLLLFLIIFIFFIYGYDKHIFLFKKIFLIIILFFFIYYIFIFAQTIYETSLGNLDKMGSSSFGLNYNKNEILFLNSNSDKYTQLNEIYINPETIKFKFNSQKENNIYDLNSNIFTYTKIEENSKIRYNYLFVEINLYEDLFIYFKDINHTYINNLENNYNFVNQKANGEKLNFIYKLDDNLLSFNGSRIILNFEGNLINEILMIEKAKNKFSSSYFYMTYLNLIFQLLFYILSLISFSIYFLKKNIINN